MSRQQFTSFSRSKPEIPKLTEESGMGGAINTINRLVDDVRDLSKLLSLQSNFDGFIAQNVTFTASGTAGDTVNIQHFLGVKPKWRIILRQVGNGVITDIPSDWTSEVITLKNNGAETVIISVFIVRE